MVKDTSSIALHRLSGSKTQLMTDLSKLVERRGSALLMAIPCPWCADEALCTFLSLESLQMRILRGTQLCTSQDPMNGILLSQTLFTHLVMRSILGPMTPLRGFLLTLIFVGSTQVPFLMCTLEIPQKFAAQVLALNLLLFLLLSLFLKLRFSQTMSFSCIFVFASSFIRMDLSIIQTQHP